MVSVDSRSEAARTYRHLYSLSRWKRLRQLVLAEQPLCVMCLAHDTVAEATVVDHIHRHNGSVDLFFDVSNLQPLCKRCHDSDKQMIDRGKKVWRVGEDGYLIEVV